MSTRNELVIIGNTVGNLYMTQTIVAGDMWVEGSSLPPGALDPCPSCDPSLNYLVGVTTGVVITDSNVTISGGDGSLQISGLAKLPWMLSQGTVSTVTLRVDDPTCYLNSQLQVIVGLEDCD